MHAGTSSALSLAIIVFALNVVEGKNDYLRFEQSAVDKKVATLSTGVASFVDPKTKTRIVLYAAAHMADADYYARVQRDLDRFPVVIHEGVDGATTPASRRLRARLRARTERNAEAFALTPQRGSITRGPNFVNADLTVDRLLILLGTEEVDPEYAARLLRWTIKVRWGVENLKLRAARAQAQQDLPRSAVVRERVAIVMKELRAQLAKQRGGTVVVFFGSSYQQLFQREIEALGYVKQGATLWVPAWRIGSKATLSFSDAPLTQRGGLRGGLAAEGGAAEHRPAAVMGRVLVPWLPLLGAGKRVQVVLGAGTRVEVLERSETRARVRVTVRGSISGRLKRVGKITGQASRPTLVRGRSRALLPPGAQVAVIETRGANQRVAQVFEGFVLLTR